MLAEVEAKVARASIYSPRPLPPVTPHTRTIAQNGAIRILPPRPRADDGAIAETLRKAILARRHLSNQTREQRVNPILMDNLAKADEPVKRTSKSPETVIEEVLERVFSHSKEEHQMNTRSVLATNFAGQQELMAEKTQKLRNEYLKLHESWLVHCSQLDSLFKANDMQEAAAITGRTTRRSAATLGDAVRSDLEMEQIIASLGNEDLTDPNHLAVRNVAAIPDMISVEKGLIEHMFDDTNGRIDNPEVFYDPRSGFFDWTPEEEATFYAKYAEFPKQFGIISTFLPHKTSSQCVLYYYVRKKRLIDFRNAANAGNGKRRKGMRKAGKQKGNALLVDVQQADSKRPASRGRRRGRGVVPGDGGRGRGAGVGFGAQPTDANVDRDQRPKRRRVTNMPKVVLAKETEIEDASMDTDQTREASVVPPKKRRGRKPKTAAECPADSPAPGETKFIDVNEALGRRKSTASSSHWTETDRDEFIRLLGRHGKDFKRIASSMPNKTTIQVSNYYKSHLRDWDLNTIVATANSRSSSPERDRFVTVSRAEASQSQTPKDEISLESREPDDRQVLDATSGIGVLTLEQTGYPFPGDQSNSRVVNNKSFINVLNPGAFQTTGFDSSRGVITSARGNSLHSLGMRRPPR
ncbi:hypothetical protein DFH11DRAFT_1509774 [Phellopilus nigrolimitatus]|nr:hypothetical protein DFH11DRAFT_1509774 [Phellopilus nigrolimitatus]